MTDAIITEYAGTRRNDTISRFYQYGSGGVRVLDMRKNIKRLYRFDPASDMMTERDPARPDRILRRFVFDRMGMLEETFSPGSRPRTFRYEQGCQQIAVREGGEFGQVGKTITFEGNGIAETAWGRHGEIERVFVFEAGNDTITERVGGWFGDIKRTILFAGINASLFREPEAFLQFLMFTEWSADDQEEVIQEQVAKIRGGDITRSPQNPYAFIGERRASGSVGVAGGREPGADMPSLRQDARPDRTSRGSSADAGIDFIPEGGSPGDDIPTDRESPARRSSEISFEDRWHPRQSEDQRFSAGKSVEIPLEDRFGKARSEREPLSKGRSAEISVSERFEVARGERETLSKGRSAEISLDERFESVRGEREPLSKGRSAEISVGERFENARGERETLSKGGSADISLDERFEGAHREREKLSKGRSAEIPYSERKSGRDR
jgi:hypothetical protein